MPTILQLPTASTVSASDEIPISQAGSVNAVSVGTLLASTQPAIMIDTGALIGRVSLGPGGPEEILIGSGLVLAGSTLQALPPDYSTLSSATQLPTAGSAVITTGGTAAQLLPISDLRGLFSAGTNVAITLDGTISASGAGTAAAITSLPTATAAAAQDLVAISQSGTDHAIAYSNLINGQTIDKAQPAAAVSDGDSFWVAQGSNTMAAQTFSAVWPWVAAKLPTYKTPVVELTTNTTVDGTVHNGRILVCSQPLTLTPLVANMGSGFQCEIVNLSSGSVSIAQPITSSSGASTLSPGQAATLRCLTYSGGTVAFASMGDGGVSTSSSTEAAPGQISALTTSGQTSNSVTLTWQAPSAGGSPTGYTVQYRVTGTTTWSTVSPSATGTTQTVGNLAAATSYDFGVLAFNGGGSGPVSATVTASTTAATGAVSSIVWNVTPSGSYTHGSGVIGINAHVTPAAAAIQFGFSTSATVQPASWSAGSLVNTNLWGAFVPTPTTAGQWYAWASGTDGSAPTVYPTAFTVT